MNLHYQNLLQKPLHYYYPSLHLHLLQLQNKDILDNENGLNLPPHFIDELSDLEDPITTTYHYINDLGEISGDHFSLDFQVKNLFKEKWAVCQATSVYFIGTTGAMIIPFSIPFISKSCPKRKIQHRGCHR